jgi:hypothetical protein
MTDTPIKILRTWEGGPLRQMAETKASSAFIPFAITIEGCSFVGKYVCDRCLKPCGGLLLKDASDVEKIEQRQASLWLCELCIAGRTRKERSPEQKQALVDRMAAARAARQVAV